MKVISANEVNGSLSYPALIDTIEQAFAGPFTMPPRTVFPLDEHASGHEAFALLPAWTDRFIGVKAFTYFPDNPAPDYRSLYSKILLFERAHGIPLALVDGTSVTYWRTAAVSALASRFLSRDDSKTLLLVGTGNLAPYLVAAHASVRPLEQVLVWGRDSSKADSLVHRLCARHPDLQVQVAPSVETACQRADIVVCATGSPEPLVEGAWIREGSHTDFIGNHHATKRECDTALVLRSRVYVDSRENCLREAGEILVPIAEGVFSEDRIAGQLADLCAGNAPLREDPKEITLFKSVGSALSDLVAAGLAYDAS
ncbi:ornithine cyclodeaminase family protein [Wenzhouxiangellaceae bacterium CH-27]|uniref:Ornithine cyclodeaminase family protein n=2 Tax=Elongatibacter sediminis TaxID=3119006 RepID=A0AAW9REE1_9GAMM